LRQQNPPGCDFLLYRAGKCVTLATDLPDATATGQDNWNERRLRMNAETVHPASATERSAVLSREEDAAEFRAEGLEGATYSVTPPLEEASVARVDLNGRHGKVRAAGTRIFYVLGGQGTFEVDGASLPVEDGDTVHVRPGQAYDYEGELTLLCVCTPAFDLQQEERVG
jgi:mannose-6-phosphate isomerase-like protein (cupin superfamily)